MNVVVFGGSGFLGSHVADALSEAGHRVTVFDRRPSPYLSKGQRMVVGDVLDEAAVARAMKGQRAVYNFAGHADMESSRRLPLETVRANVLGNTVLLEAARRARVGRFVFASSLYVYSKAGTFYRASKQACEAFVETYREVYGLRYTILRFGSLYGPRSDERNGMHRLVSEAVRDRRVTYWGDGQEVREYIHVQDAARSSVDILQKTYEDQCVILTGQQAVKVGDLLVMIREIVGRDVKVRLKPGSRKGVAGTHYKLTPYSFTPKEGRKLVRSLYTDLGQGILSLVGEFHRQKRG